jgi:hypothetical protein
VVRDTKTLDELIESTRDAVTSPEQPRAPRRSFVFGSTTIANPEVTREIIARGRRLRADFQLGMICIVQAGAP